MVDGLPKKYLGVFVSWRETQLGFNVSVAKWLCRIAGYWVNAGIRMKEIAIVAVIGAGAIAALLGLYGHGRRREVWMLRRWAGRSRFELLCFRQRAFVEAAPFSFWTSHRTPNYFVTVRDEQGRERSGWVRLGTVFESIYWDGKDKVEVKWEDTPAIDSPQRR
jgi:hypothetical protein